MKLTYTEKIAFNWLLSSGYKITEIVHKGNGNPDFLCSDGKGYEVKSNNDFTFTEKQVAILRDTDIILVVKEGKVIEALTWKEIKDGNRLKKIKKERIKTIVTSIRIEEKLLKDAKIKATKENIKIGKFIENAIRSFV
jgi:predicted DNA binding CopG/RHH family protein